MIVTLGAAVLLTELTTFGGGVAVAITRIIRKLSRIDELPGKIDDVKHELEGIRRSSEQWRETSDQWHRDHMDYFHPNPGGVAPGRRRGT